jgi:F-type H+-transporting ATPase subunit epsilon
MKKFLLEIISLEKHVYDGQVVSVTVPGVEGELTILPNHMPLLTPLRSGEIVIRDPEGGQKYLAISKGFVTVEEDKVTILADNADLLEDLNEEKILAAKKKAEEALKEKKFADDRAFADTIGALEHSIAQLKILRKRRKRKR